MLRKIIAGIAVAGVLSLGVTAGPGRRGRCAGAATPSSTTSTAARCAKLPAVVAKVQKVEAKLAARLPKAQAREATLRSEGQDEAGRRPGEPGDQDREPREQGQRAAGQGPGDLQRQRQHRGHGVDRRLSRVHSVDQEGLRVATVGEIRRWATVWWPRCGLRACDRAPGVADLGRIP